MGRKGEIETQMVKQKDAISRVSARDCTRRGCGTRRGRGWKRRCLKWQLGASEQGGFRDFTSDNDRAGNHVRHDDKNVYGRWRWNENGERWI